MALGPTTAFTTAMGNSQGANRHEAATRSHNVAHFRRDHLSLLRDVWVSLRTFDDHLESWSEGPPPADLYRLKRLELIDSKDHGCGTVWSFVK